MNKQNLIIFNTFILYGRMLISAIAILLSTRVVLQELGAVDYGIYNLLVGIISMLSFLNAAMSAATQRYLSYALGKKDDQHEIFYYSVVLHVFIAAAIVCIIEIGGHIFLNSLLNIPHDREIVAHDIIDYLCFSVFFTIISVPYDGVLNAHENMLVLSIIGCIESILKLLVAFIITFNIDVDKLLMYSLLMCIIPLTSFLLKKIYCIMKYPETKYKLHKITDTKLFKDIFSFAGWNLIGASSSVFRSQGYAVLFNVYSNVVVNAAYGIANQVNSQITFFSDTIIKALRPQITISEGEGNRPRMLKLSYIASKVPFLLLLMVAMPIIVEAETLLKLWLGTVPKYSMEMVQLTLLVSLITLMTKGTQMSVEAVGNIKYFQIFVGCLHFFSIPLGYLLLLTGLSPYFALLGIVIEELIGSVFRIIITHNVAGLDYDDYLKNVILRDCLIMVIVLGLGILTVHIIDMGYIRMITIMGMSIILCLVLGYNVGLTHREKEIVKNIFNNIMNKINK